MNALDAVDSTCQPGDARPLNWRWSNDRYTPGVDTEIFKDRTSRTGRAPA
jgi:hypothetical protein